MSISFTDVNWLALLVCVVLGQIFLTVWFAVIFAKPWASAYGVASPQEHTRAIPGYTYGLGAACVFLLSFGLQALQSRLQISGIAGGVTLGVFVALFFAFSTALPGYAFLKRWRAFALAIGSQATLVVLLSTVLAVWPR
ncbi:MAG: DUF1761 domain-containing protein [Myxococcota bacterium]